MAEVVAMDITCAICGSGFTVTRLQGHRPRYCGTECRAEAARQRASARYELVRGLPETKANMARHSRASYERKLADPEALELQRAQTRAWRSANPDRITEQYRQWRTENATRVAEKNRRRRARLLAAWDEDVDILELVAQSEGKCGICREPIDTTLAWPDMQSLTLDHIMPLSRGGRHRTDNCQPAHAVCNARKNDRVQAT